MAGQDMTAIFAPGEEGRLLVVGELLSGGPIIIRETSRGTPAHCPFAKKVTIRSWVKYAGRSVL